MDLINKLGQDTVTLKGIGEILYTLGTDLSKRSAKDVENAILFMSDQLYEIATRLEKHLEWH